MTSLFGIIGVSIVASVGNSIVTESVEKNYRDMRRFNFMYMLLAGWAVICMLCLYQPFVQLWMGGALTGSAVKVGGAKVVNGASTTATSGVTAAEATVIVNGVANSGQSKLFVLAGLAARLLLCTVIVAVGYYLAYHWTERYKDAKSWIGSRYRRMRREE